MTKFIVCPRCRKPEMCSVPNPKNGMEYFAKCCGIYFGQCELENEWNYDAADLITNNTSCHPPHCEGHKCGLEFVSGEPLWETVESRVLAYEVVTRMILDIPEFDDYLDLRATELHATDVGIQ